ncbi:MAG: peptidase M14, partial [Acidobacteriota bacterium]|nr:peptidase M14 [Acidobacteriota bacterium]
TRQLASADLSRFHVIILPDAGSSDGYASTFGSEGMRRLKDWVLAGGTLVGVGGGAVSFLSESRAGLLSVSQENAARAEKTSKEGERGKEPEAGAAQESTAKPAQSSGGRMGGKLLATEDDYNKAIQADSELPDAVAGVLMKARLDPDHWISAGVSSTVHALVEGRAIFTPIKLDKGVNAAVFLSPAENLASGYLWEENRKQLAFKPFVIVQTQGRGIVVGFTADPNFRAYMDGLNVLFLNAVFRGTAHARPAVDAGR